jgi:hypothetical protein
MVHSKAQLTAIMVVGRTKTGKMKRYQGRDHEGQ